MRLPNFRKKVFYISLASDVATTYINIARYDKQIQLLQATLGVKAEQLRERPKNIQGCKLCAKLK